MNKIETFKQFLSTQSVELPVFGFLVNLLLAALLSWLLAEVYSKYGTSLSNRKRFSLNLIMLSMITMVIITIVKSSLALSLGLVGALSIVRFRSAIKEPEELLYLFFSIAIGLGLGADQRLITVVAFIVISIIIIILSKIAKKHIQSKNMNLIITTKTKEKITINEINKLLQQNFKYVNLKRYDENSQNFEASFIVHVSNFKDFNAIKSKLYDIDNEIIVSFIDINLF